MRSVGISRSVRILLSFCLATIGLGCRQLPPEIELEPEPEEGPFVIDDFWGPQWLSGEYILGLASLPGDSLFVSTWSGDTKLLKTGNLGATWEALPTATFDVGSNQYPLHIIEAESSSRLFGLYLISMWHLAISIDGGTSWKQILTHNGAQTVLSLGNGRYLVGLSRQEEGPGGAWIYENDFTDMDNPNTWIETDLDRSFSIRSLARLKYGEILAGTAMNGIYISRDNAETFERSELGGDPGMVRSLAEDPSSGRIFVGTTTGLFLSNDVGNSWHPTNFDAVAFEPLKIVAADARRFFVLVEIKASDPNQPAKKILFTDDAGDTWGEIAAPSVNSLYDIFHTESQYLLLTTSDGVFRSERTTDQLYETAFRGQ